MFSCIRKVYVRCLPQLCLQLLVQLFIFGGRMLFCSVPRCFGEYQMQWKAKNPKRYICSFSTYGVKQDRIGKIEKSREAATNTELQWERHMGRRKECLKESSPQGVNCCHLSLHTLSLYLHV